MQDPAVEVVFQELSIIVETAGQGPAGPANLFIQNAAPVTAQPTYLWVQTMLGAGTDFTLWIEDGL